MTESLAYKASVVRPLKDRYEPSFTAEAERAMSYLELYHGPALALVSRGEPSDGAPLQDACDVAYSLVLLGRSDMLSEAGARAFVALASRQRLAGGLNTPTTDAPQRANVHLTAYVLGVLALYKAAGHDVASTLLDAPAWAFGELFDATGRPRWPKKFSHHAWRVSHWIGGAPSILFNLWRLVPERCAALGAPALDTVLDAADTLIAAKTGLLNCYRSDLLQALFRSAYRIRHDPDAGDIGGVVHLHWVGYAKGRLPYKDS